MRNINEIINKVKNIETKNLENISIDKYKGKNIMTFGTFDLLHIGHTKIIDHALTLANKTSNLFIGVSSDKWNELKGKKSVEDEIKRMDNILRQYPGANVMLEDHSRPEETWPMMWDEYDIDLIVMGGDHFETLAYINNIITPNGNKMKITFYERTPEISSTLIRSQLKEK